VNVSQLPIEGEPGSYIKIDHDNGKVEIVRAAQEEKPEQPEPVYSERLKQKVLAEIRGGQENLKRLREQREMLLNAEAKRAKLATEIKGDLLEAAAQGTNVTVDLNPGNQPIGRQTAEGDVRKVKNESYRKLSG